MCILSLNIWNNFLLSCSSGFWYTISSLFGLKMIMVNLLCFFLASDEFRSRVTCEGEDMVLRCKKSFRIAIYSAMFGRSQKGNLECPARREVDSGKNFTLLLFLQFEVRYVENLLHCHVQISLQVFLVCGLIVGFHFTWKIQLVLLFFFNLYMLVLPHESQRVFFSEGFSGLIILKGEISIKTMCDFILYFVVLS